MRRILPPLLLLLACGAEPGGPGQARSVEDAPYLQEINRRVVPGFDRPAIGVLEAGAGELERAARRAHLDNDEMAVWCFLVLLRYEPNEALYARWLEAWTHEWTAKFDAEQAAWWDVVHGMNGGEVDPERIRAWLRSVPVDMIRWNIDSSARRDLIPPPPTYFAREGRMRSDGRIVPYDERPTNRWNTDSFHVVGGLDGRLEMDGADVLAPYWMARYYGWIR